MDDSGAILCQISIYKDMLDQVNSEIEANIKVTREIESEMVKCSEIESNLSAKESELTRSLLASQFEIRGLISVASYYFILKLLLKISIEFLNQSFN
uniref:Uncharacterized protein n=1 Tax=Noccaea caerulescens TaxID=107243 RepID=A0A1J3CCZ8_NOCCA